MLNIGLSIFGGTTIGILSRAAFTLGVALIAEGRRTTVRLTQIEPLLISTFAAPELSALTISGADLMAELATETPAVALDVNTRAAATRAGGGSVIDAADASAFAPGQRWLMLYEITGADSGVEPPFAPSNSPFGESGATVNMPGGLGQHAVLLTVREGYAGTGVVTLLRSGTGGNTVYANLALYRAEWLFTIPDRGPEVSDNTAPGLMSGVSGQIIASPTEPLEIGARYELSYTVTAADPDAAFFLPSGAAFAGETAPPATVGTHKAVLRCGASATTPFLRKSGTPAITISALSLRKVLMIGGLEMSADVNVLGFADTIVSTVPLSRAVHVAPGGDDIAGDGTVAAPYATPQRAVDLAERGDTISLAPGTYGGFRLPLAASGTADAPITVTAAPGFSRQAIIDGTNFDKPGQHGVEIRHSDHIHIRSLTIRNWSQNGVYITGSYAPDGEVHGGHVVSDCLIAFTGQAGIHVEGWRPWDLGEKPLGTIRVSDVLIEDNDISYTNMVTPHNLVGGQPQPGGVNECVTVVSCVGDVVVRRNDIHDSRQYGVDFKHGVIRGEISRNRIWNIYRYGIYLDSNVREVENIDVFDNMIWGCRTGFTIAREGQMDKTPEPVEDRLNRVRNINVYRNTIWRCRETGLFIGIHPGDGPYGEFENVAIYENVIFDCGQSGSGSEVRLVDLSVLTNPAYPTGDGVSTASVSGLSFTKNVIWRDLARGDPNIFDGWTSAPRHTVSGNTNFAAPFVDPAFAAVAGAGALTMTDVSAASYVSPANYGQWAVGQPYVRNAPFYAEGDPAWEDPTYAPWMTEAEGDAVDLSR